MSGSCLFCGIVAGHVASSQVYDDSRVQAFLDLHPVTPGHTLVVPKAHASTLAELDLEDGARLFQVAQRCAGAVRRTGLRADGVNLWLADGAAAGQEVLHVHLHVVPRFEGDGFRLHVAPDSPSRAVLDDVAVRIRSAL